MIVSDFSNSRNDTVANINADFATVEAREWHEWVVEAPIFDEPVVPANASRAFRYGFEDAQQGAPFAPEMYFASDAQMSSYTLGFLSAQPGNVAACVWWTDFTAAMDAPDVDYAERSL